MTLSRWVRDNGPEQSRRGDKRSNSGYSLKSRAERIRNTGAVRGTEELRLTQRFLVLPTKKVVN